MRRTAFDTYHPCAAALYFAAVLVLAMAAFQPVFVALSAVVGIIYNVFLRGWRAALKTLAWQLPVLVAIMLLNGVLSARGSTLLLRFGHHGLYLESFVYGLFMGLALIAVLQWFSNLSHVLTSDKVMQLTGNVMPTVGLMITMILRLVPQYMRRGRSIRSVEEACTSARAGAVDAQGEQGARGEPDARGGQGARNAKGARLGFLERRVLAARAYLRDLSVLMGWGMEDSLDTSDAMRARGWGVAAKRTTYQRSDFRAGDGILCACLAALIAASAICAFEACAGFAFYPQISPVMAWWAYVPYALLLAMPFILEFKERAIWRMSAKSPR